MRRKAEGGRKRTEEGRGREGRRREEEGRGRWKGVHRMRRGGPGPPAVRPGLIAERRARRSGCSCIGTTIRGDQGHSVDMAVHVCWVD